MIDTREFQIPKRNGKWRKIVAPDDGEKAQLLLHLETLNRIPVHPAAHGFILGRSPVTNAVEHIGFHVSICFDLADFFDTVKKEHIDRGLERIGGTNLVNHMNGTINECLYKGYAAQGLPTSPALSNIAALPMDYAIEVFMNNLGRRYRYTRYADDLTISLDETPPIVIDGIIEGVRRVVSGCGFLVNDRKTQVQYATGGKRNICGVLVGQDCIRATKKHRRRLRAIKHLRGTENGEFRGLQEWIKLKKPRLVPADEARWKVMGRKSKKGDAPIDVARPQRPVTIDLEASESGLDVARGEKASTLDVGEPEGSESEGRRNGFNLDLG